MLAENLDGRLEDLESEERKAQQQLARPVDSV